MYRIFDEISQSTNNSSRFALKIKVKKILGDRPDSIPLPFKIFSTLPDTKEKPKLEIELQGLLS